MNANPYAPTDATAPPKPTFTVGRRHLLVRRVVGIPLGGVAVCLVAEFVADHFHIHGFRGNDLVTTKLVRAFAANLFFAIPYIILSLPLLFMRTTSPKHSLACPLLGGAIGILVPRTMIGYSWEVQNAMGVDSTTLFFFAAGCGAVAGCVAELAFRMVTTSFGFVVRQDVDGG